MRRSVLSLAALGLVFSAHAAPVTYVIGEIRIQALSDGLVRIEKKGPHGFEDRPTFTAIGRAWPGTPAKVVQRKTGVAIVTSRYTVLVPIGVSSLKGIRIEPARGASVDLATLPGVHQWLPSPSALPPVFLLPDHPRMVPPAGGAIPKPPGSAHPETSGYDTGNDAPDVYAFVPKNYETFRADFLRLTGPVPMVPRYALGFWNSRYHPYTDKEALGAIDEYRKRHIPLDLFTIDTDWRIGASNGYASEPRYFPDIPGFLRKAHAKNVRVMFNDHPEPQTKTALDPKETQFRWDGLTSLMKIGLDVWWFDRNWWTSLHEPMPGITKEVWGQSVFHDVTLAFRPDQRPLIMTNLEGVDNGHRSYAPSPAGHRYPIWWTGDTGSTWQFLRYGVENGVDSGVLSLHPYVGEDLGGHVGAPSPELYVRYLQYGSLSPTTRVHCTRGRTRYPWDFGPEAERLITQAIRFRYRLMPTLYTAARRAFDDGTPLLRRLDLYYPKSPEAKTNHEYLLGDDLLVAPVLESIAPAPKVLSGILQTPDGKPGLRGEYFANQSLRGEPVLARDDATVAFDWGEGSPDPSVPNDHFSARWTGKVGPMPKTMDYHFSTTSDDGSRLWIDNKLIVNAWVDQDTVTNSGTIHLEAGKTYDLRLEYFESAGSANCLLGWEGADGGGRTTAPVTLWVPPGRWVDPWSGQTLTGPRKWTVDAPLWKVPMLVRRGGILFTSPQTETVDKQIGGPVGAEIYPTSSQTVRTFYEDDGNSNEYLKQRGRWRDVSCRPTTAGVQVVLRAAKGSFRGAVASRDWTVRVHLPAGRTYRILVDGSKARFNFEMPKRILPQSLDQVFQANRDEVAVIRLPRLPEAKKCLIEIRSISG